MQTVSSRVWLVDRQRGIAPHPHGPRPNALAAACLIALMAFAPAAGAQGNGKGCLFSRPVGSFSLRAGYAVANAASDVFNDATSQLTLNKGDFGAFDWGGDISYSTGDRFDLVFDGESAKSTASSESRLPG